MGVLSDLSSHSSLLDNKVVVIFIYNTLWSDHTHQYIELSKLPLNGKAWQSCQHTKVLLVSEVLI